MLSDMPFFIKRLTTDKKRLFLIDGLGALLTALCLGVILIRFESAFGMPKNILYYLAAVALGFAIYSLCCHFYLTDRRKAYLRGIAIANLFYCCVTTILVFVHYQDLTVLGLGYFLVELMVVACLIIVELMAVNAN